MSSSCELAIGCENLRCSGPWGYRGTFDEPRLLLSCQTFQAELFALISQGPGWHWLGSRAFVSCQKGACCMEATSYASPQDRDMQWWLAAASPDIDTQSLSGKQVLNPWHGVRSEASGRLALLFCDSNGQIVVVNIPALLRCVAADQQVSRPDELAPAQASVAGQPVFCR